MSGAADPLETLRTRFLERCREDLAILQPALENPARAGGEEVKLVVHRLAGVAGVFGYAEVGRLAGVADDGYRDGGTPAQADLATLAEALEKSLLPSGEKEEPAR